LAQPLVSIILATYNRSDLLPRAVESVLLQSWHNWELIIVDDCSTDGTPALLEEFAQIDFRVRTIRQQRSGAGPEGPGPTRNRGLREASGDLITVLDSDDAYAVDHLTLRVRYMIDHPEVDFIYGGYRAIGNDAQMRVPDIEDPSIMIPLDECIIGGTFFTRRGVIERAGGWDSGYGEDARLFSRIRASFVVRKVDYPTYLYHRDTIDSRCSRLIP